MGRFGIPGASATANRFGISTCWIVGWNETDAETVLHGEGMVNEDASNIINHYGCVWHNTAKVGELTFFTVSASNFVAGTRISVYAKR